MAEAATYCVCVDEADKSADGCCARKSNAITTLICYTPLCVHLLDTVVSKHACFSGSRQTSADPQGRALLRKQADDLYDLYKSTRDFGS